MEKLKKIVRAKLESSLELNQSIENPDICIFVQDDEGTVYVCLLPFRTESGARLAMSRALGQFTETLPADIWHVYDPDGKLDYFHKDKKNT